jgi:hypothetical protein
MPVKGRGVATSPQQNNLLSSSSANKSIRLNSDEFNRRALSPKLIFLAFYSTPIK